MTPEDGSRFVQAVRASPVYALAHETALQLARGLSARLGAEIWLKREDQQVQFSFKVRGACHAIAALPPAVRARGVVTASAGNHGQGVALAARHFGVPATVVMPRRTPSIKVNAVRALGAEVRLEGTQFADAAQVAMAMARTTGATLVHPFDDRRVIEGQATLAAEILRQHRGPLDTVVVPVGGGGLIAGLATYLRFTRPEVRVVGVEPIDSDAMWRALAAGRPVPVEQPGTFADGVAVREAGAEPFKLTRAYAHGVVRVGTAEIRTAMREIFEETRGIVEPAGALAVAGLRRLDPPRRSGAAVVAVLTGANVDFRVLGDVAAHESRERDTMSA